MSKIFEEALADAKKLKEVAEANAKKAILESVTPRIKEFIEQQILEQDNNLVETKHDVDDVPGPGHARTRRRSYIYRWRVAATASSR